jgi:penicillin-binding protein 1B
VYAKPSFITLVRSRDGRTVLRNKIESKPALDPRVAYLITNLMEEVLRSGTGVGVRERYGFLVPAAGKTGTSHDGWFAGFTTQLLCVVWVGFDDNTELDLEGAHSAAPIWANFMKKALDFREYRDAQPFQAPDGIVTVSIDPESGMLATPACPQVRPEVYIAGTQPLGACPLHGGRQVPTNVAGWEVGTGTSSNPNTGAGSGEPHAGTADGGPPARRVAAVQQAQSPAAKAASPPAAAAGPQPPKQEKKGFFQRLLGVFK